MAARSAARIFGAGSLVPLKGLSATPVTSLRPTNLMTASFFLHHSPRSSLADSSLRRSSSCVTRSTSSSSCGRASCGFSLSAPRRAGHHALQHHEVQQITPRYTDDIPAEYYKYGAFKNLRNDSSIVPNLVRSGAAIGITFGLALLNDIWSCEHWHYKHRLAGSYLEAE